MKTTIELAEQVRGPKGCDWWMTDSLLERFAELVRAEEREACASECDEWIKNGSTLAEDIAAAIRARGNT